MVGRLALDGVVGARRGDPSDRVRSLLPTIAPDSSLSTASQRPIADQEIGEDGSHGSDPGRSVMARDSYDGSLDLIEDGLLNGEASITALLARSFGKEEHLPPMLYRLWRAGRIDGEWLREAVACTWTYSESPKKRLSEAEWIELFKAA